MYDVSDLSYVPVSTTEYQQTCGFRPNLSNPRLSWVMLNPQTGKVMTYRHREVRHENVLLAPSRGWQVSLIEREDLDDWKSDVAMGNVRLLALETLYRIVLPEEEVDEDPSEEEVLSLCQRLKLV